RLLIRLTATAQVLAGALPDKGSRRSEVLQQRIRVCLELLARRSRQTTCETQGDPLLVCDVAAKLIEFDLLELAFGDLGTLSELLRLRLLRLLQLIKLSSLLPQILVVSELLALACETTPNAGIQFVL